MWGAPIWPPTPPGLRRAPGNPGRVSISDDPRRSLLLLHDFEQLHFEDERRAWLDLRRRAAIAVGGVGGTDEAALATDLRLLHALAPALDHAAERKRDGLAPLDGAVEHRAVHQGALVVHLHLVRRGGTGARAGLERGDDGARGRLDRALLGGRLVDEGLARLPLRYGRRGDARLLQLLDLRAVRLEIDLLFLAGDAVGDARLHDLEIGRAQRERRQVLRDDESESVERLLLFRLQLGLGQGRGGRGRDEEKDEGEEQELSHRGSFRELFRPPYARSPRAVPFALPPK